MTNPARHGRSAYINHGCRCQVCKDDHAAYARDYLQRRKARTGERILHGRFIPAAGSVAGDGDEESGPGTDG
jgi:hypothetical protein